MKITNYASASLNDIVFEGRNHEYGAYLLRKTYHQNLERGLFIAVSVFMLLLAIPLLSNLISPPEFVIEPEKKAPAINIIEVIIPPVAPVVPPAPETTIEPQKTETQQFSNLVVRQHITKPVNIPTQKDLGQTTIGTKTEEGQAGVTPPIQATGEGTLPVDLPATTTEVVNHAGQMPEFPGGNAALQKYLSSNLKYPALAFRNNVQGTVILSFVVNVAGEISDIQVLKSLGGGTDEEAKRVVKSMPRWSPGSNNGIPVNVRFVVPVRFAVK